MVETQLFRKYWDAHNDHILPSLCFYSLNNCLHTTQFCFFDACFQSCRLFFARYHSFYACFHPIIAFFKLTTTTQTTEEIHSSLSCLPLGWSCDQTDHNKIRLCKLVSIEGTQSQPVYISHCVVITDSQWEVYVNGHRLDSEHSTLLMLVPNKIMDHGTVRELISILDSAYVCHGYPKREYIDMVDSRTHRRVFRSHNGLIRAHLD